MTGPRPPAPTAPRIGVDLVPLARIPALLDPASGPALHRMLSARELDLCAPAGATDLTDADPSGVAGRLAAKEAVFKLFHATGQPLPWLTTEILRGPGGRPEVRLSGRAARLAEQAGLGPIDVSISHDAGWAIAVAAAAATVFHHD
ncbi:holo-ACP synthase [Streptomyces sp. NPDC002018]|uniref:holo-ACP synthase n=1 Tax=Streptomyces sp. NPDC002018 TaxID=3364629 RepID=UPI0036ABFACB